MEIYTLVDDGNAWVYGESVQGLDSKLWIERFRPPGEFKFIGPPSKKLLEQLSIGTLLSQTNSRDVMIVEDHEIVEEFGSQSILSITGRSLDSFFDHRAATDQTQGFSPALSDGSARDYEFTASTRRDQIRSLIRQHVEDGYVIRSSFKLPHVEVRYNVGFVDPVEDLEVQRQQLSSAVLEILEDMDCGIHVIKPFAAPVSGPMSETDIILLIDQGRNLSKIIQFVYSEGDIEQAKYFTSSRDEKNAVYISSRYRGVYYPEPGFSGFDQKVVKLDANDLKLSPANPSFPGQLNTKLTRRAKKYIAEHRRKVILEATISSDTKHQYGKDYLVGDIVTVIGNYSYVGNFRVMEYILTEDEDGQRGYPVIEPYNS